MRMAHIPLVAVVVLAGCNESLVPNYASPNPDVTTQLGFQTLVTGLAGGLRNDFGLFMTAMSAFARDAGNFTNSEPQEITEFMGAGTPLLASDLGGTVWANQFQMVKTADSILVSLPRVSSPAPYSTGARAQITGVIMTFKALAFIYLAETRDTVGVPIGGVGLTNTKTPAPIICNKDVWRYIVAVLDSANVELNVDTTDALPITLPAGFSAVGATAGPSTRAGAFAAFNRALAGKANLELAYAIARSTAATAPSPSGAGQPDATALQRADSALQASALYQPAALAPPAPGAFTDANAVYQDFSSTSGDLVNPINQELGTLRILNEFVAAVDTANDARWKNKFIVNPFPPQLLSYSGVSSGFAIDFYPSAASPVPIVRNEELVLVRAQVRLGLNDLSGAWTLINQVRSQVGTLAPLTQTTDYVTTRDALLREQRISTVLESSSDRAIAIRMYGLAAVADTTWGATDTHVTLFPLPSAELIGRNGNTTPQCQ
jgi:hypothetical protein